MRFSGRAGRGMVAAWPRWFPSGRLGNTRGVCASCRVRSDGGSDAARGEGRRVRAPCRQRRSRGGGGSCRTPAGGAGIEVVRLVLRSRRGGLRQIRARLFLPRWRREPAVCGVTRMRRKGYEVLPFEVALGGWQTGWAGSSARADLLGCAAMGGGGAGLSGRLTLRRPIKTMILFGKLVNFINSRQLSYLIRAPGAGQRASAAKAGRGLRTPG